MEKERVLKVEGRIGLSGAPATEGEKRIGMKWYNFLLVEIIFSALLRSADIVLFVIAQFSAEGISVAERVCDTISEVFILFVLVFQLYTWWQLKKKSAKAPRLMLTLHGILAGWDAIYVLCCGFIEGNVMTAVTIALAELAWGIIMVCFSYVYFSKRKELFVD